MLVTFFYKQLNNAFKALLCVLIMISSSAPSFAQDNTFSHTLNFESSASQFEWVTSAWSECDIPCGGTYVMPPAYNTPPGPGLPRIQYREAECRNVSGEVVADVNCNHEVRPALQRNCTDQPTCRWVVDSCTRTGFCFPCIFLILFMLTMCISGVIAACVAT